MTTTRKQKIRKQSKRDKLDALYVKYMSKWNEQFEIDRVRIPNIEKAVERIQVSVDRIEKCVDKQNTTLYGNGEPEKALLTRMGVVEKAMEKIVGTDQWRKVVLVSSLMSFGSAVAVGLFMRFIVAAPK